MDHDLTEIMSEFAYAVHAAQMLEYGLGILLTQIAVNQRIEFTDGPKQAFRKGKEIKSLAAIFKAVREKEYFTPAEENEIWAAINLRNDFVHSFLVDRGIQLANPNDRQSVLDEISAVRATLLKAGEIVDHLINKYLAEYGMSIEDAIAKADKKWGSESLVRNKHIH